MGNKTGSFLSELQRKAVDRWLEFFGIKEAKDRDEAILEYERHRDKVEAMLSEMRFLADDVSEEYQGDKVERLQRLFDKAQDDVVLDYIERELAELSMAFTEDF